MAVCSLTFEEGMLSMFSDLVAMRFSSSTGGEERPMIPKQHSSIGVVLGMHDTSLRCIVGVQLSGT